MRIPTGRSIVIGAAALIVIMAVAAGAASTTVAGTKPAAAARLQVPRIRWSACPAVAPGTPSLKGFLCAKIAVPLDYSAPGGRKIELGLVKHVATSPGRRVGTVFFNPGGPGDPGSVFLPAFLKNFGAKVIDRFDIVTWDPRGMGGMSAPVVQCFDNQAEEEALIAPVDYPPLTSTQQSEWARIHAQLNRHCAGRDNALLAHVSTADNARDLDLIRRAVGESKLFYYGTSYGTFLGATYANMFPDKVERMVLDGVVYAKAWANAAGPLSTFIRVGSDQASAGTLQAFLALCGKATTGQCAFSAHTPAATRTKFNTLLARAKRSPIVVAPDEPPVSESSVIAVTVDGLYVVHPVPNFARFEGWSGVADELQALWTASSTATPSAARAATDVTTGMGAASPSAPSNDVYFGVERQLAVICGESPNPRTQSAYKLQANISLARAGLGGQIWPWIAYCVDWPVRAASPYLGPWNHHTANPAIVVGTTGDPATPYHDAVLTSHLLPGARLITLHGYGHTSLANPSHCVQNYIAAYLLHRVLPRAGASCNQDTPPFH
jgi:pimeloyl-ACP methyl ester carboxylesterase